MTKPLLTSWLSMPAMLLVAAVASAATPINIVTRAEWGWEPAAATPSAHTVTKITIHHGGSPYADDRNPVDYLRALQKWSRSDKGWIDLPYHYVIDLEGRIFEGRPIRYPGDTNTSYDPRGHALIVVVGNYDKREFSDAQFESLAQLAAYLAREHSVGLDSIKAHLDYAPGETACPGANIYRRLEDGSLLRRVAELARRNP